MRKAHGVHEKPSLSIATTEFLYPNPTNNMVTFTSNSAFGKNEILEVYNYLYQKIFEYNLVEGENQFTIDTSPIQQGVYVVKHTTISKHVSESRLTIIR